MAIKHINVFIAILDPVLDKWVRINRVSINSLVGLQSNDDLEAAKMNCNPLMIIGNQLSALSGYSVYNDNL